VAEHLVIYSLIHQPRRVRLPAAPLPRGAPTQELEQLLFDADLNRFYFEKVARWCYRPATQIWAELLDEGMKLGLGVPLSTVPQFERWAPDSLERLRAMVAHDNCELIAVEPYHGMSMLLDLPRFVELMRSARSGAKRLLGAEPTAADTTEMLMSSDIYRALHRAGYGTTFIDGRPWVMEWRESTHPYTHDGLDLRILPRHFDLSDDVGYRFSNMSWDGWPLMADEYADWIRATPGDFVLLAWDFETFGEHHRIDTGIFDFLRALPRELRKRGITCLTPSEAAGKFAGRSYDLPLSPFPATWAGMQGGLEFFLGNHAQRAIFRLMSVAYDTARLSGDDDLIELAHWLMQSDNLHWLQWVDHTGSEADVSAYFTPQEWLWLGTDRLIWEQQRVYVNFINAIA
jgi:alpha-amylase